MRLHFEEHGVPSHVSRQALALECAFWVTYGYTELESRSDVKRKIEDFAFLPYSSSWRITAALHNLAQVLNEQCEDIVHFVEFYNQVTVIQHPWCKKP